MRSFKIINRTSGADMGVYEGATEEEALLAMVRDGGGDAVEDRDDWIVEEVEA